MPISIRCDCGKTLNVDEKYRGKKVKCPACGSLVLVQEASETGVQADAPTKASVAVDDADAPAKRRPIGRPEAARSSMPLILGAVAGVAMLFGCLICGAGSGFFFYRQAGVEHARAEEARKEEAVQKRRAEQVHSSKNLKHLCIAALAFHDIYKMVPPPATVNPKNMQPLVSWRVMLLPYLEENILYNQIRLNEPWDSEHNRQSWTRMPKVYELPGKPNQEGKTYYQVFQGSGSVFSFQQFGELRQFGVNAFIMPSRFRIATMPDGVSNTIFAVEAAEPVHWMKPDDIPFRVGPQGAPLNLVGNHWGDDTFHVAFFDSSVMRMRRTIPPDMLQHLITPDDGRVTDQMRFDAGRP